MLWARISNDTQDICCSLGTHKSIARHTVDIPEKVSRYELGSLCGVVRHVVPLLSELPRVVAPYASPLICKVLSQVPGQTQLHLMFLGASHSAVARCPPCSTMQHGRSEWGIRSRVRPRNPRARLCAGSGSKHSQVRAVSRGRSAAPGVRSIPIRRHAAGQVRRLRSRLLGTMHETFVAYGPTI